VITISEANYQNNDPISEDKYIISPISVKKISEEKNVVIKHFCHKSRGEAACEGQLMEVDGWGGDAGVRVYM
jgi:hypothetical protein